MLAMDADERPLTGDALTALAVRMWGSDLALMKERAAAEVDAAAEVARRRFITPGSGQAMEYLSTETEAQDFDAGGKGPWPFLEAERDALGGKVTLAEVAAAVQAQVAAWRAVGGEIKRLRRAAKMAIDAAKTAAEVAAATVINWPDA